MSYLIEDLKDKIREVIEDLHFCKEVNEEMFLVQKLKRLRNRLQKEVEKQNKDN